MLLVNKFETQAKQTPDRLCLVSQKKRMTFRKVDELSNFLGNLLNKTLDGSLQNQVGLLLDHDCDMVVAMLSVLKTNNIYVPMDQSYPLARMLHIMKHAQAKLILTDNKNLAKAQTLQSDLAESDIMVDLINIETIGSQMSEDTDVTERREPEGVNENDLAYILYTSGSTGQPKGVMQKQANVVYFVEAYIKNMRINEGDKLTLFSSYCHDASVMDIYAALLSGATLHIIDLKQVGNMDVLSNLVDDYNITIWHSVPTVFRNYLKNSNIMKKNENIRLVVLGGEAVLPYDVNHFKDKFPYGVLYNLYGQTESSYNGGAFYYQDSLTDEMTLGDVVPGTDLLVLDEYGDEADTLEVGEIVVVDGGIALGYWQNDSETQDVFVDEDDERLYFTGDMGKFLTNGQIKFEGRQDKQVKIRGYRVDLGEIESKILELDTVSQAAVILKTDKDLDQDIIAFVSLASEEDLEGLRSHLRNSLTQYMLPSHYELIENLPKTSTDKVDRKALAKYKLSQGQTVAKEVMTAGENPIEIQLIQLYKKVLKLDYEIGRQAHFFDLGGHSLKATTLVSQIHKALNVEVSLIDVFNMPVVADLAQHIDGKSLSTYHGISQHDIQDMYPLTSAQQRIYLSYQLNSQTTFYNMEIAYEIKGTLDLEKFQYAFDQVIERHSGLRSSFLMVEDMAYQKIRPVEDMDFKIAYEDLSGANLSSQEIEDKIQSFIKMFDLEEDNLFRVHLVKVGETSYVLFLDMHHIISDGTSKQIIMKDFVSYYSGDSLEALKIDYKDYTLWQEEIMASGQLKKEEDYWLDRLSGDFPILNLKTDFERSLERTYQGDFVQVNLDEKLKLSLVDYANKNGGTVYTTLLTAFYASLQKFTGQEDVIIGSLVAGRHQVELENVVGLFINTLLLRNYPQGHKTLAEFYQSVKDNTLADFNHQKMQLDEITTKLDIKRDMTRNTLYDVMFIYHNMEQREMGLDGLAIEPYSNTINKAYKLDLTLVAGERDQGIELNFCYALDLFKKETMESFAACYKHMLQVMVAEQALVLDQIQILGDQEKEAVVQLSTGPVKALEGDSVLMKIKNIMDQTPDRQAITVGGQTYTYSQLEDRMTQISYKLKTMGLTQGDRVAIILDKSLDMIASLLAVQSLAGIYVPIDATYPEDRKNYILKDATPKILIGHKDNLKNPYGDILALDDLDLSLDDDLMTETKASSLDLVTGDKTLYIMYTSGTSGQPKGVMISHKNVMAYVAAVQDQLGFSGDDVVMQQASYSFDTFVEEVYPTLACGGHLVLVDKYDLLDTEKLIKIIDETGISIVSVTPLIVNELNKFDMPESLRLIISGGDVLKYEYYKNLVSQIEVYNTYGPTETTVCSAYYKVANTAEDLVPIGKPINNYKMYIMNEAQILLPRGQVGEICISGVGVAQGYWQKDDLTKDKFMANPYEPGQRLYRTGDLGRFRGDGNIEFLGRIDNQIKIRGQRIELAGIEANIKTYHPIEDALVVALDKGTGDKYLCAYVIGQEGLDMADLKSYLAKLMPDFMIPSHFVQLDTFPVTANGKIDHEGLPSPQDQVIDRDIIEARTQVEKDLVVIFQEIIGISYPLGIKDSFFDLGGHSLRATTLMHRIHKNFKVKIPLIDIFTEPTIEALAQMIEACKPSTFYDIEAVETRDYYPMSAAQKRMYIVNQMDPHSTAYNIPTILKIKGHLNVEKLTSAFRTLMARHETLRTQFEIIDNEAVQRVMTMDQVKCRIEESIISEQDIDGQIKSFIKPFDLSKGPLFRLLLAKVRETGDYLLIFDKHHIISDGVSELIMTEEFVKLYTGGGDLEANKLQYRDFSAWQNDKIESQAYKKKKLYWMDRLDGEIPVLDLAYDFQRPKGLDDSGDAIEITIDKGLTKNLNKLEKATGSTRYMSLLASLNVLFHKVSHQEDILIGSPIAGRNHTDLEGIVGMFVNTLVMRNYPKGDLSFNDFLLEVKKNALEAYGNQEIQFEDIVDGLNLKRDRSRNPLFDIAFRVNNQNTGNERYDLNGLELAYYNPGGKSEKFDMTITAYEIDDEIVMKFSYSTALFKKASVTRLAHQFLNVVAQVGEDLSVKIQDISLMSQDKEQARLDDLNKVNLKRYYQNRTCETIQDLLKRNFIDYKDKTAISYRGRDYSYKWLDETSDRIAQALSDKGQKPGDYVGVFLKDQVNVIPTLLGILKTRGVFLPLNEMFPDETLVSMSQWINSGLLICDEGMMTKAKSIDFSQEILSYQDLVATSIDGSYKGEDANTLDDLYVCFTSGTTGQAKPILGWNGGLKNFIDWEVTYLEGDASSRVSQLTGYSNDAYFRDVFTPLFMGGSIQIPDKKVVEMSGEDLKTWLTKSQVSVLHCTPSLFAIFNDKTIDKTSYENLDHVLLAGEALSGQSLENFFKTFEGKKKVTNLYGASETTLIKMYHPVKTSDLAKAIVPIGRPIAGTGVVAISGKGMADCGQIGEMHIKSPFMTKGYLGDKKQNEGKFVKLPLIDDVLYKTGDLVRLNVDGDYEFVGRLDDQVKIRGNRVELAAIESKLLQYPGINKVYSIISNHKGLPTIATYYTGSQEHDYSTLRNYLKKTLADYMIPTFIMKTQAFILNANGKVDRQKLPKLEFKYVSQNYVAPRNNTEKTIENCWRDILEIKESIGIEDDFFEVGGHSLALLKLADILRRKFDLEVLNLIDLYENPTIASMASFVDSGEDSDKIFYELTKNQASKVAIYATPYMAGDASCYGALARELDQQGLPVKLCSTSIFDIGSEVEDGILTVEKFAKIRAEEIKEQGEDNVVLLGHCGGAILALAIADELKKLKVDVKAIISSGFVPRREPNKIIVESVKRRNLRQYIVALRGLGFADKLNVTVAKKYRDSIIEMFSFRYRRKKKVHLRIFRHKCTVFSIVAHRDPETFDHKRGHRKWKRYARKVKNIVVQSKSHYFISRDANKYAEILDGIFNDLSLYKSNDFSQVAQGQDTVSKSKAN